jgi:apolipoprotein N-acyltransferase
VRQIFFVVASAVVLWMSFPPVGLGFLVFAAPVPFLWAMRRTRSAREAGWLGFMFGALFFGALMSWLAQVGVVAWLAVVVVMGSWASAYALVLFTARHWSPWRWWGVVVGCWALMEFVRSRFPFGGLSWGSLGHPVGTLAWPRGAAQWIGSSGWAVVIVAMAAAVVLMFDEEADRRPLEIVGSLVIALTLLGAIFVPDARGAALRVAVVQGSSPCPGEHCEDEIQQIFAGHIELTTLIESGSVDLILWGEDSFGDDVNPTFDGEVRRVMGGQAALIGSYLVAAGTRPGRPGEYDNYSVVFDRAGEIVDEYRKRHPVAFGEYIPLRRVLQVLPQVGEGVDDMARGDRPGVFPIAAGEGEGMFGVLISFEATFDRHVRSTVAEGAQVLVVHANTASFGEGAATDQIIGMIRMSAASLGVDVVVASITGKSTIVRADGSMGRTTELFSQDILRGGVNLQTSRRTVFAVAGDWLQITAILAGLIVLSTTLGGPSRDFKIRPERRR